MAGLRLQRDAVADFCKHHHHHEVQFGAQGFKAAPAGFRAGYTTVPDANEHFFRSRPGSFYDENFLIVSNAVVHFGAPCRGYHIADQASGGAAPTGRLEIAGVKREFLPGHREYLAARGYDARRYGARPLKRAIRTRVALPLAAPWRGLQQPYADCRHEWECVTGGFGLTSRPERVTRKSATRSCRDAWRAVWQNGGMIGRMPACQATGKLENEMVVIEPWNGVHKQAQMETSWIGVAAGRLCPGCVTVPVRIGGL